MTWEDISNSLAASKFIIYGLIALLLYVLIPEGCYAITDILKNLLNAAGSILLVGGIFEIVFKDKFIKEVSNNFVKTIFLDPSSLQHFTQKDLEMMKTSLQNKLLNGNSTEYTKKILHMINESFFNMARGTHKNPVFNMYFQYYNSSLYVKKRKPNSNNVEIEYKIKYELINNSYKILDDNKFELQEAEIDLFAKRFFPLTLSQQESVITQELLKLTIKCDENFKDYAEEISQGLFIEKALTSDEKDDIRIQEDVKKQIQKKPTKDSDESTVFMVKFKKSLIIEKTLKIITTYNDITFSHIFKRPTINYSIQYIDENVDTSMKDYLTLKLFSGLNKKVNDKIHPALQGNVISLHVSEGLLLPGEGVIIVALREYFLNNDCNSCPKINEGA